ncbi:hypothetical protein ATE92_0422 [Ulvibacter sp. MAR_2010_11]|uniref:carboxypeptidase-like regulatory domain-containing protein n=1 Tax=Ulvibacter sp. MAR_2010_11 TaxID=1250229 RepID=UPI000C2B6BC0|nr:carboxypeptidase-like regulatory domain-containing protein [Ulvibacter sp. MAR_2010_11]PKA82294.1 hypothetical protein ATE92_0422 [Ulvibacter sp. MAR_2010_11]
MYKLLLLVVLILLPISVFSQEIERVKIQGLITAPQGEDVEGVSVYNISAQTGTITNAEGAFEIEVAENDRIQITALQFQSFTVIIDRGVVAVKRATIYLNPAVNQLKEITVRPYDLSGNIVADVNRIDTYDYRKQWDLSYETMEFRYEFSDDALTSIKGNKAEEAFYNGQKQASLDFVGLTSLLFSGKRKNKSQEAVQRKALLRATRERFSNDYITKTFEIPEDKVNDFFYFIEDKAIETRLLKTENELLMIDFLAQQSVIYKQQLGKN